MPVWLFQPLKLFLRLLDFLSLVNFSGSKNVCEPKFIIFASSIIVTLFLILRELVIHLWTTETDAGANSGRPSENFWWGSTKALMAQQGLVMPCSLHPCNLLQPPTGILGLLKSMVKLLSFTFLVVKLFQEKTASDCWAQHYNTWILS